MALKAISKKLPALRLYEQILLYVALVVFIPLLTLSFIIYGINQKALKKELVRFTEHTAEIIYTDISAQMASQQAQARLIGKVVADGLRDDRSASDVLKQVLALPNEVDAIGLYSAGGERLISLTRPEIPLGKAGGLLPAVMSAGATQPNPVVRLQAVPEGKKAVRYVLQLQQALPDKHLTDSTNGPAVMVLRTQANYLTSVVHAQNAKLDKGFFLVDAHGNLIAGPDAVMRERLKALANKATTSATPFMDDGDDWQQALTSLRPGVSQVLARPEKPLWFKRVAEWLSPVTGSVQQAAYWVWEKLPLPAKWRQEIKDEVVDEDDARPPVEKVLMKLPNGWGVVVESPYEVRQKYVKRARTQTLLLILAHLLLVGTFTFVYTSSIRRNFRQLIKGIQALAEGRYSRRIRLITNWFTPFEIIFLTGEFNRMSRRREEAWEESETLTQELRTANDKLAELDKMKSNLIDTVSHELRTPLTSIKGYTSRLIRYDDTLDGDMRLKSLKTIKRQADRLNRLVDDLLVIPELEQHHLRIALAPVKLRPIMERSRALVLQSQRDEAPMGITLDFPEVDPVDASKDDDDALDDAPAPMVLADSDRLEQVLVNLLDNAMKYGTPNETITVAVAPQSDNPEETNGWAISVANPCPPETLPASTEAVASLFEKFKRMDDTTTRTTRGTGLGLFITRGLVEAMGGTITASVTGEQFMVTFWLPAATAAHNDMALLEMDPSALSAP